MKAILLVMSDNVPELTFLNVDKHKDNGKYVAVDVSRFIEDPGENIMLQTLLDKAVKTVKKALLKPLDSVQPPLTAKESQT